MNKKLSLSFVLFSLAVGAFGAGCGSDVPVKSGRLYDVQYAKSDQSTVIQGLVWDPEAFFLTFVAVNTPPPMDPDAGMPSDAGEEMPMQGPPPPLLFSHFGYLDRALLKGATVSAREMESGMSTPTTTTDESGTFTLTGVPTALKTYQLGASGTAEQAMPDDPMAGLPPIPGNAFLPTYYVAPTPVQRPYCANQTAVLTSDKGAAEAVALFLSKKQGTTVTAADLVNPAKFGGVAIWWTMAPGFWFEFTPVDSIALTADHGDTVALELVDCASLPPAEAALCSARGFIVSEEPTSSIGLYATVLPPSSPTQLTLKPVDTVMSEPDGRPLPYSPREVSLVPGAITYGFIHADTPFPAELAGWAWQCQENYSYRGFEF